MQGRLTICRGANTAAAVQQQQRHTNVVMTPDDMFNKCVSQGLTHMQGCLTICKGADSSSADTWQCGS
jgi:hypothetical protein